MRLTKIFAIGVVTLLCSFFIAEKVFTLKFSEAALNNHFQNLSAIKNIVDKSNLPHQEVVFIVNSIDSLQKDIVNQVKTQTVK